MKASIYNVAAPISDIGIINGFGVGIYPDLLNISKV